MIFQAMPDDQNDLVPGFLRAQGRIRAAFGAGHGRTFLARHYEAGGFRLRVPNRDHARGASGIEAVMINTGGGLVGGDCGHIAVELAAGSDVTLTSQSAEKVYGSQGPQTRLDIDLRLGPGARLDYIPQETILFRDACFSRQLSLDMASDARLILLDSLILGRKAAHEDAISGTFRDKWRISRDGKLVFAENVALGPDLKAQLARPAVARGAMSLATFLFVAPDAEAQLEPLRALVAGSAVECGFSAWNGLLAGRFLTDQPSLLRSLIQLVLRHVRGRELPRVWM